MGRFHSLASFAALLDPGKVAIKNSWTDFLYDLTPSLDFKKSNFWSVAYLSIMASYYAGVHILHTHSMFRLNHLNHSLNCVESVDKRQNASSMKQLIILNITRDDYERCCQYP